MSGLSDAERSGCTKLLCMLSRTDLFALSDTVTNKMIAVENIADAMEAVLSYTKDAEELLKRKKVHRDIIFKYLAMEGIVMPPQSEKHLVVKRTLEFWSAGKRVNQTSIRETGETRQQAAGTVSVPTEIKGEDSLDPGDLGKQFCQWFFHLLNSQNPSLGQLPQDWGPQHFWPDAELRLLSSTDGQQTEEFQGAELVSLRLLALARDERLFLSPNLQPHGFKAMSSPHGLVLVAVAGTIHRDTVCLGVYEQAFGLIRSPLDNNSWKIKFVKLKIRAQDVLSGTEATSPSLTYDSAELQQLCR